MLKTGTMALRQWHHSTMSIVALDILYTYIHVTKQRQWILGSEQAEGALKTGFQAVTGVAIQVWEENFYLITRIVRARSRFHFLTWPALIVV